MELTLCDLCYWECKESRDGCEYFSLSTEASDFETRLDLPEDAYLQYINDSYKDYMEELGYHADDEWYLDPQ